MTKQRKAITKKKKIANKTQTSKLTDRVKLSINIRRTMGVSVSNATLAPIPLALAPGSHCAPAKYGVPMIVLSIYG